MLSQSSSRSKDSVELGVNSSVTIDYGVGYEKRVTDEQKVTPLSDVRVARKPSACFKAGQIGGLDYDSLTLDAGGGVDIHSNQNHKDIKHRKIPEVCRYAIKPVISYLVDEHGSWAYSCLWENVNLQMVHRQF